MATAEPGAADGPGTVIKCVIWDIDNTLLDGVYLESAAGAGEPGPAGPPPSAGLTAVLAELAGRGILHALASRNPPAAAGYVQRVTGHRFAAAECGWDAKSQAIRRILATLDLPADAVAFVDDDALERAEVAFALPGVTVLAPEEMAGAADWPQFSPAVVTDEARRRGELYLARQRRQEEASAFGGSRADFLRWCQTRVTIGPAGPDDLPRLHELSVRTHQFNSSGVPVTQAEFDRLLGSAGHRLVTVRLADRFGDDGLVGGCVLAVGDPAAWDVPLLMMSCRAMGRGVIDALLAWLCGAARAAGADRVTLPCVINPRNVPLRIALTGAGFRVEEPAAGADSGTAGRERIARYTRPLDLPLPDLPDWVVTRSDWAVTRP